MNRNDVQRRFTAANDSRPVMIDACCGAGGASMGYHRLGFRVIGIDINPQPHYPFEFIQADIRDFTAADLLGLGAVAAHGSPPCQLYTNCYKIMKGEHPDLVAFVRELFTATGLPWIIENVVGAPLIDPITLCGAMFPGLMTYRHRLFETSFPVEQPPEPEHRFPNTKMGRTPRPGEFMHVVGHFSGVPQARLAMGIDWMTRDELAESIPPAYSEFMGAALLNSIRTSVTSSNAVSSSIVDVA